MKPRFLDEITEKISSILPHDLHEIKEDTRKNIRAVLQSVFEKMDLVTREEFEVQKKILARSQERIQQLTETIQQLEQALQHKQE